MLFHNFKYGFKYSFNKNQVYCLYNFEFNLYFNFYTSYKDYLKLGLKFLGLFWNLGILYV